MRQQLATLFADPVHPRARTALTVLVCAMVVALAALQMRGLRAPVFPVDDAYITLHNAISLRQGGDTSYVGVPPLVGATSAVHVALVTALLSVCPDLWALWLAGWIGTLLYALGILRIGLVLEASAPECALLVVFGLLVGQTPHQLTNGLETSLAMAGVAWALAMTIAPHAHARLTLPALLGVLPFLRPELLALSLLLSAFVGVRAWHEERVAARAAMARFSAAVLLGAAPWALLYWHTTGVPFPNTVQAKRFFFAEGCAPTAIKLDVTLMMLRDFFASLGLASLGALLLGTTGLGRITLVFAGTLVGAYFVNLPGALGHYENRYVYILVPMLLFGITSGLRHPARWIRWGSVAALILGVAESAWSFAPRWQRHLDTIRFTTNELAPLAEWSNANLPIDAKLLVHDAGYISWATKFRLFDIVGLKTPSSIPVHRDLTWKSCVDARTGTDVGALAATVNRARATAVAEIARLNRPTHLVVLRRWEAIYATVSLLRAMGWSLEQVREGPFGYDVYQIRPPS